VHSWSMGGHMRRVAAYDLWGRGGLLSLLAAVDALADL
jgi:hypothetical protein